MEENLNSSSEHQLPESEGIKKEGLIISVDISLYLAEIAKWSRFIAIFIFVMTAFMVVAGVIISITGSTVVMKTYFPLGGTLGFVYIALALLYYFPAKYLYDFSTYVKQALYFNEQESLDYAFNRLKSHYKFIGILMLVLLCFYVLIFISAIIFGFMGALGK